jgi:hypothetical protein
MYANVLRAGTLTDDRVVQRVSRNFVPTHFNNNDPTRAADDPSAVLWKAILRQKNLQGQGVWVLTPDGAVIAGMSAEVDGHPSDKVGTGPGAPWRANPKFADAVVEMLAESLRKFGPVTPRHQKAEPLPYRGAGVKPDGGVRLVVYNRADNGLAFSVKLTADEWRSFVPTTLAVGKRWSLPESVAREFAPVLSPLADTRFRPQPSDLQSAELTAEVETLDARHAEIRLAGRWHADWRHDGDEHSVGTATAEGIAVYDLSRKAIRSLLLIFDGTYGYTTHDGHSHRPSPFAAVVRWRLDGDAE